MQLRDPSPLHQSPNLNPNPTPTPTPTPTPNPTTQASVLLFIAGIIQLIMGIVVVVFLIIALNEARVPLYSVGYDYRYRDVHK